MTINLIQHYEYACKFIACVSVRNSFVFSTDNGLLIVDLHSDLFRPTADYKIFRTWLAYSKEKPFEDKNFSIRHQGPVTCQVHNLMANSNSNNWNVIYMTKNSTIVFLEKQNNKWIEKLSDIPQKWFLILSKKSRFSLDQQNHELLNIDNGVLRYCRDREKSLHIKSYVFTQTLKCENEIKVYGTICCHTNNMLTFWSTKSEKSSFLVENEYHIHHYSIKYIKWFQISNELSWLIVFLTNGQVYIHEITDYPHVRHTFILWLDEDFACVRNIWVESISDYQCLIFITKMSFVLVILYSLTENKIISTKKELIPLTTFIPGFTYIAEKKMLIVVTDVGRYVCMYFSITKSEVTHTLKIINNNFKEQVQNFTCTSVVFSKNQCSCVLTFECNIARYSKNDGHIKNKLLFCVIPENLVELENKILSINNSDYYGVIDCIETLRINRMNEKSNNELYQLDRKYLDKCSIEYLKLTYMKIVFKSIESEYDQSILQELQMLLHVCHLNNRLSNKKFKYTNAEKYYCRIMLSHYMSKLSAEYVRVKRNAANLINSFDAAKHTVFCKTCDRIIVSCTDFRMFICELGHKELRCPVTLGPLGMPCLVCSMCFTMADVNEKNQSCVWCFGKYVPNGLLF